ncbi:MULTISPECIES: L-piperidine-6-carboxylate dehydrogenase [Dechloromonas]|uniref:Aldehyde dehydrogenase n=1 Tax=Dechloromonas denitrificans TaxID=281362 RepID=A0A133XIV4_9RHOO|nr:MULTISPECIES: aldehyde dehydrogenase family protein [Dechloromonas]KXB30858.1 aldehyde dehydrogenase [Dechloromonas denitrificans]
MGNTAAQARKLLADFGNTVPLEAGDLAVHSPIDGARLANLRSSTPTEVEATVAAAQAAFLAWRMVPAPRRGELVRRFGEALRRHKVELAELVTIESGKIRTEALGEVQEMIDICDFAVGLSRQLYGLTIASERPRHRLMETWHPLGVCGVITAFNFPVAVWAWNTALALVCGDAVVWKPSEKTPLTALACHALLATVADELPEAPAGLSAVLPGGSAVGTALTDNPEVALLSATGSSAMGRAVAPRVAARFGRCLLELGGNNGMIVTPTADLDLALRAIVFAAAGTAGQRCTSLRRLFVHESVAPVLLPRLVHAYASLVVGDPRRDGVLIGPLIDAAAFAAHQSALLAASADGGRIHGGESVSVQGAVGGFYVRPALVEMPRQTSLVSQETFAPILYVMTYRELVAAIELHNAVPQGLASAIFTSDLREMELFLSACGSDCGIANVNIGTSGAEIGGAFGGEKASGGGREAGSDAWKSYMRRATNTINYSRELPLAQGVTFF